MSEICRPPFLGTRSFGRGRVEREGEDKSPADSLGSWLGLLAVQKGLGERGRGKNVKCCPVRLCLIAAFIWQFKSEFCTCLRLFFASLSLARKNEADPEASEGAAAPRGGRCRGGGCGPAFCRLASHLIPLAVFYFDMSFAGEGVPPDG